MCCCVRASQCCAVLSVISWHGLLWQRNKPAWPMITPTANRHLCMGEAWLGPQIAPTPPHHHHHHHHQPRVCVHKMHAGLTSSLCVLASSTQHMYVWDYVCASLHREQWTVWSLILSRIFKHWAPDPDTPRRAKPENSSKWLLLLGIVFIFSFSSKQSPIRPWRHRWVYLDASDAWVVLQHWSFL